MLPSNFIQQFLQSGIIFTHNKKNLLVGWGNFTKKSQLSTKSQSPYFYFPDFFLQNSTPWLTPEHCVEISIQELLQILKNNFQFEHCPISWESNNKDVFKSEFQKLQGLISQKVLDKAVPYIFETSPANMNFQRLQNCLISALQYVEENHVYLYGYWEKGCGILGATPEILFHQSDQDLKTMACAGSAPSGTDHENFKNDPKEKYEHDVVIQGIKNAISSLGGDFRIDKTEILNLPNISHLMTHITSRFKNHIPFENLVISFHPTPALGAIPREEGFKWLAGYDMLIPRNQFGAPVGYYLPSEKIGVCYVAIRNVQWSSNQMKIGAGCGIVRSSIFEKEWAELQLKIQSIKKIHDL